MAKKKRVYLFGGSKTEGRAEMKNLLGGKGANLAEMARLGIPVPPGFTITTDTCIEYQKLGGKLPPGLKDEVKKALAHVEKDMGRKFGDPKNPLLVSVRSGARVSMPGMMETVLNVGLNEKTIKGLIGLTGDERFAYDCYRRLIQMYSNVVMGMDGEILRDILDDYKKKKKVKFDVELSADDWKKLIDRFKKEVKKYTGKSFPENEWEQLWGAIGAVFESWNVPKAVSYRKIYNIPEDWGTAVNVQTMVFGNMGENSATGVAFTRDPSTGKKVFYGEYLPNAQGEDVVAGIRTPQPINEAGKTDRKMVSLEKLMPGLYRQLDGIQKKLERHYKDMQDIEFTIENGRLWMLQTRVGKRTAHAEVKIAVDMYKEKLIDKETAVLRVKPEQLDQLLHPMLDPKSPKKKIAKGLNASPGAASGKAVFNADEAEAKAGAGEKVLLVRLETSPEDIHGMHAAEGILTARGGMTSHAAVVARGMGKPCVAGCSDIEVDYRKKQFKAGNVVVKQGDYITIDGATGEVYLGRIPTIQPKLTGEFGEFMKWVDDIRKLGVRTNADTPKDSAVARNFGAEGIGLCRTEHMFFEGDRIFAVQEMILADDEKGRRKALEKILPYQKKDFVGIFKAMEGLPVTIRLLDPPLHEFLPHTEKDVRALAKRLKVSPDKIRTRVNALHEFNPMLGHRGCRLGITYPEIYEVQVRAIFEAACQLRKKKVDVKPEVMIPLVGYKDEFVPLEEMTRRVADEVMKKHKVKVHYLVGTMIELPRAALTADEIADRAEFFSFGTNDLTQTGLGMSRDDAGKFLRDYIEKKILPNDPFQTLDQRGIGELVEMGTRRGRATRKNLKVGICGEHGGDPESVKFCHRIGMDYVSCSPYRVPIARLAAAHAALEEKQARKGTGKKSAKKAAAKKKRR